MRGFKKLLSIAAVVGLIGVSAGCVAYAPAQPAYYSGGGYYAYPAPAYGEVVIGGGHYYGHHR